MSFTRSITSSASEDRLEKLIEERLAPAADKAAVDERIWDLFGEEWAILFTDMAGFSRNVAEFGIIHFLQVIHESKKILIPVIDRHDGILLKTEGDSMLVIFRNPAKAVDCAVAMQHASKHYNAGRPASEQVLLCVGIGFGRVLRIGDSDVFGAEVNSACKLGEERAEAWAILATDSLRAAVPECQFDATDEPSAFRLCYDLCASEA